MQKKRILFVKHFTSNAKFVSNDIDILSKHYIVKTYSSKISGGYKFFLSAISQFFFQLFNSGKFDLTYIWFADYHSFLPVLFSKITRHPVLIAVGGYDATYIPEINMGLFVKKGLRKRLRCFCAEFSLKNCTEILPVDKSLIENENKYIYSDLPGKPVLRDGIKNFIPEIETPFKVVRLGYNPEIFRSNAALKERAVVSAGYIMNENELRRKGFDVLIKCARKMPDVKFILAGLTDFFYDKIKKLELENLELYKNTSYEELISLYSRSKVYSQLSMFEGMPSAVCEAMLCGCIPVGSAVNGIPDIIGNAGIIIHEKKIDLIINSFYRALNSREEIFNPRERIIQMFSLKKREDELLKIAEEKVK